MPSLPVNSNYEIDKKGKPDIRALFTDSNMRSMKVTFLPPEQRQSFKAVMLYRQEKENSFPENRTMTIQLKGQSMTVTRLRNSICLRSAPVRNRLDGSVVLP